MNFKDKYRADMCRIKPDARLLSDTATMLASPTPRHTWRWGAVAAICAAALVCAVSLPLMQSDDLSNQPALLSATPDITAYSDSVVVGDFPSEENQPLGRSAMPPGGVGLTEDIAGNIGFYIDRIPYVCLAIECSAYLLPHNMTTAGVIAAYREMAQFKIFN